MHDSILWRRIDQPGHEFCELIDHRLRGVALFTHEKHACRLDYEIECDPNWKTKWATVRGFVGDRVIDVRAVSANAKWTLNGVPCPLVDGCLDIDLNLRPSTNLLPIRREAGKVTAAWLRFPSFLLEPLEQTYTRLGERSWRYESAGGKFVAELEVNDSGLPTKYGNIRIAE